MYISFNSFFRYDKYSRNYLWTEYGFINWEAYSLELFYKFKRFIYQDFIPVTKSILVLTGVIFLLHYILLYFNSGILDGFLILTPASVFHAPWTLITYPLLNPDPIAWIFSLLWLWFIGGSLERTWGSWPFFTFVFMVTVVTGILMTAVGWFFANGSFVVGLQLPLVAITWAWAGIYPDREMLFFGIIPLKAMWLAWIYAAFTFFQYAKEKLVNGIGITRRYFSSLFVSGQGAHTGLESWVFIAKLVRKTAAGCSQK